MKNINLKLNVSAQVNYTDAEWELYVGKVVDDLTSSDAASQLNETFNFAVAANRERTSHSAIAVYKIMADKMEELYKFGADDTAVREVVCQLISKIYKHKL